MNGTHARDFKLRNVRLTLSKLDAKYSKSSVLLEDEDLSPDLDGSDALSRHSPPPASLEHVSDVEPEPSSLPKKIQQELRKDSTDTSEQMRSATKPASVIEQGSPSVEDDTSLDTASSIESVKTDSILGFNNVHSVSSLADSVLKSDEMEHKINSPSVTPEKRKLQPDKSSSVSSDIRYRSVVSNKDTKEPVIDIALNSLSLESIQRQTASSSERKTVEIITGPNRLEMGSPAEEEPLDFSNVISSTNVIHEQAQENSEPQGNTTKSSVKITPAKENSQDKTVHQCGSKKLLKLKRKSIAVQTHSLSHPEIDATKINSKRQKDLAAAERSMNIPVIKATKLPYSYNNLVPPASTKARLQEGTQPGASDSIENELSTLISHHLYLTKEFLERQHRMYLANCKAVQLLEKGYQENLLHGMEMSYHQ